MRLALLAALLLPACRNVEDTGVADADGDGWAASDDCDDSDATVNPGADETWYDGIDQNCDGNDDDRDGDGAGIAVDCDDAAFDVHPGQTEVCDGIDDDCDGTIDVGASGGEAAWTDADGDGYGAGAVVYVCPDAMDGYAANADDCDDASATVNPSAPEICDAGDDDCDGEVNEGDPAEVWYALDADGDGYGDPANEALSCSPPTGFVSDASDCDDHDPATHPGAAEDCAEPDRNCDGDATAGATDVVTWHPDADEDGHGDEARGETTCAVPDGWVADGTDCDDTDPASYLGAAELCDLQDNDCDGAVDDDATVDRTYWGDADGDGWGDLATSTTACGLPAGYVKEAGDCDDTDAAISPVATETCDGVDQDCDGVVDDDATDASTYYPDDDGDGFGDAASPARACEQPAETLTDGSDCDDGSATSFPGGTEVCDSHDNDCDGTIDEPDAVDAGPLYVDSDGDAYGTGPTIGTGCPSSGTADRDDDCDDLDPWSHPGGREFCDDADNDCDGAVDESGTLGETDWYPDVDGDGYGDDAGVVYACDAPSGYTDGGGDCDDGDAAIYEGASERDDGADDDCDGIVDEDFVAPGDVVITEITRQPRVGSASTVVEAQWFEVANTSARTVDLTGWFVERTSSVGTDGFRVEDPIVLAPGDAAVFCKTEDYAAVSTSASTLACDYVWGDPSEASTWSGTWHDNTFNLQRDEDTLELWLGADATSGTLMDAVSWTYDATAGYWPRDATQSTALDPSAYDATANDDLTHWCSTATSSAYRWYSSGSSAEYGTPGSTNPSCP